jgi:hypothetical protein
MEPTRLETEQIEANIYKLRIEVIKMIDECLRLRQGKQWYPFVWSAAMMGVFATMLKVFH